MNDFRRSGGSCYFYTMPIVVRVRFGSGARQRYTVADERRAKELRAMARDLVKARIDAGRAAEVLQDAAQADAALFRKLQKLVAEWSSQTKPEPLKGKVTTFRTLAQQWLNGELAAQYPDHVRRRKPRTNEVDRGRLDTLIPTIGDVPIARFTLEDAERAMAALPDSLTSSTRRQYATIITKVLKFACYPLKLRTDYPIPPGWLPRVNDQKAKPYLYPSEDARLLACTSVPIERRMLWGFLAREGMRLSEALALDWTDIDLTHGSVRLDSNKTNDPRAWALNPAVVAALKLWQKRSPAKPFQVSGLPNKLALLFRRDLKTAGVDRAELFERTDKRQAIRVHDLRGTFVTLSLAGGKTETWVADRTGHRSSIMINRYRRQARTAAELGLGELAPLNSTVAGLKSARRPKVGHAVGQSNAKTASV